VCVSDKHVHDGFAFGPPWRPGLVIGHEYSATVVEAGPDVDGWAPGTRVAVDPRTACGACDPCRAGLATLCAGGVRFQGVGDGGDGALADLVVARAERCFPLPDTVSDLAGALVEPAASVTRAVRGCGVAAGDRVAVLGLEDYGLLAVQRLAAAGARVMAADPDPRRREAAAATGAVAAIEPGGGRDQIRALREALPGAADVVVVCMEDYVPAAAGYLALAHRLARPQGTLVVLRTYGAAPYAAIDPQVPYLKELTVRHFGAFFGEEPLRGGRPRGDWQLAVDALADRTLVEVPGTVVVDFGDLERPGACADLMALMPGGCTKALVRVAGKPPSRQIPA
jgi:threonine dehydrogenase-like Zn-dependent dehydrogenase